MLRKCEDNLLTWFHRFVRHTSEKGYNSAKYLLNFAKSQSGHLHLGHNLYTKYDDPSSSGSPDILLSKLHRFTMQTSKRGIASAMTNPTEKKKI